MIEISPRVFWLPLFKGFRAFMEGFQTSRYVYVHSVTLVTFGCRNEFAFTSLDSDYTLVML